MKVQEVTKMVIDQLDKDKVGGINLGVIMAVIVAADACGVIKQPCNTRMHMDTKPKHHYRHCGAIDHKEDAEYCYSCGGRL